MSISKLFLPLMSVVILASILIGFAYIQAEISSLKNPSSPTSPASSTPTPAPVANGHPNLICTDNSLSVVYEQGNHYLKVDANITNVGNGTAFGVFLWIQTYFPNGTEAINYNMTLYEPRTGGSSLEPLYQVSIFPNQSYLVQSGNSDYRDFYVVPDNWAGNNDFLASYIFTPFWNNE